MPEPVRGCRARRAPIAGVAPWPPILGVIDMRAGVVALFFLLGHAMKRFFMVGGAARHPSWPRACASMLMSHGAALSHARSTETEAPVVQPTKADQRADICRIVAA